MKKIDINATLAKSWEIFKKQPWVWILLGLLSGISASYQGEADADGNYTFSVIVISLVVAIVSMILEMGIKRTAIDAAEGKNADLSKLFSEINKFWRYLGTSILYGLIVFGGMILLVVPGIIWAIQFHYASYLVIDKNMRPIEALKESSRLTAGRKWSLFGFFIVLVLVNIAGALLLLIGLLVTIPLSIIAGALVYKALLKSEKE